MKGIVYFAFFASVQASLSIQSSHSHQPTGNTNCKTYIVKSGDTCSSIGRSTGATWAQLLSWSSDINSKCSNLGSLKNEPICISNPSGSYAIPIKTASSSSSSGIVTSIASVPTSKPDGTNPRCAEYHQIQKNETCLTIEGKFGISKSDFIFLNPELNSNCTNLQKAASYCVKPVGYISTYSGYGEASTKSFNKTPMTSVPASVGKTNYTSGSYPVISIAKGTRKDCYDYLWIKNVTSNALADCWSLAITYDISPEDFILWNPSLDNSSTASSSTVATKSETSSASVTINPYAYPCTLSASLSYCVELSSPTST